MEFPILLLFKIASVQTNIYSHIYFYWKMLINSFDKIKAAAAFAKEKFKKNIIFKTMDKHLWRSESIVLHLFLLLVKEYLYI